MGAAGRKDRRRGAGGIPKLLVERSENRLRHIGLGARNSSEYVAPDLRAADGHISGKKPDTIATEQVHYNVA